MDKTSIKERDTDPLAVAFRCATEYLQRLQSRTKSVSSVVSLEELRTRLHRPFPTDGTDASTVVQELAEDAEPGLLGCGGGSFFAWVIGGAVPSALATEWLTATWDQNAALYACSPSAAVAEEIAGEWLKQLFGLPSDCSFAFTTGCQLAHFTCLAAARYAVLNRAGWNVNEDGLFGAPRIRVIVSDQRHGSIDRALRYLGIGNKNVFKVPTDSNGVIDEEQYKVLLDQDTAPTIVVLDAGDLNIAAMDTFAELIPIARARGAWVHIDGAFGLFACASRSKRSLVKGLDQADSWATDGHKWLNVPFDCGFAFVRDRVAHRESMTISASYIAPSEPYINAKGDLVPPARDEIDWNPEWSRRARGFSVYAALRELGSSGVENLVDRCCKHCYDIVTGIGRLTGAEVLWTPTLNQGLVRFMDTHTPNPTIEDHNRRTADVIAKVNNSGTAFFSGTLWRGIFAMRVSVVNWQTTEEHVHLAIEAVRVAIR